MRKLEGERGGRGGGGRRTGGGAFCPPRCAGARCSCPAPAAPPPCSNRPRLSPAPPRPSSTPSTVRETSERARGGGEEGRWVPKELRCCEEAEQQAGKWMRREGEGKERTLRQPRA
eukprot:3459698-Rhodomonas_salina.1